MKLILGSCTGMIYIAEEGDRLRGSSSWGEITKAEVLRSPQVTSEIS